MLSVNNVKKSFGGVEAIQGSDFSIETGEITALIGPNGAGKTTLFNIIGGFIDPDFGRIFFKDQNITNLKPHQIANLGISRTFQNVRLFEYLTIEEHLEMIKDNKDMGLFANTFGFVASGEQDVNKILDEFSIERVPQTMVSELSYGQRKLLDLAMSFHKDHEMLMLDEPVAGVNKVIQEKIENWLLDLKQEDETVLLIDHDMDFIRKLSDQVIVLDAGEVLVEGEPQEVLNDDRVLEAYLGE